MMADLDTEFDTKIRSSLVAWCILNKAMRGNYLREATPTIRLQLIEVQESLPCKELKVPPPSEFDVSAIKMRLKALGLQNVRVERICNDVIWIHGV
jgi:hypothetical protein